MTRPDPAIRPAAAADLPAIAALQAASWRSAYAGLLPADFFGPGLDRELASRWARLPGADGQVTVADAAGTLIGFAAVRIAGQGAPAYLDNLHVLPALRGGGVGRALMAGLATALIARGARSLYLTVLTDNAPARAFYARMGGRESPESFDEMHGLKVRVHRVDWDDLAALSAAVEAAGENPGGRRHCA